jgi:hypothetical protein
MVLTTGSRYALGMPKTVVEKERRARKARPHGPVGRPSVQAALSPTDPAALDDLAERIARDAVLKKTPELAAFLQEHLTQALTAYVAGIKDIKSVGQWARGRSEPSAIGRERLRAAYQATALLTEIYDDRAAQGWFFGANHRLDDQAPAAVLREAETPDEIARIPPLARAFVRGAL